MIAARKICINFFEIQQIRAYNAERAQAGEQYGILPVPTPIYKSAEFSFRSSMVLDWFIDPESKDNDIIAYLQHRGEIRLEYDPGLEGRLRSVFSVFE